MKKGQVFISYASQDIDVARRVFLDLKVEGLHPWMDKPPKPYEAYGLLPGENWRTRLSTEINESQFFIAILSKESVQKKGYVQREFRLALDLMNEIPSDSLFLFPLLMDDCTVPELSVDTISIRDLNWHHYHNGGLKPIIIGMRRILNQTPRQQVSGDDEFQRVPLTISKSIIKDDSPRDGRTPIENEDLESNNPSIKWKVFIGQQKWKNNPLILNDRIIVGSSGLAWNTPDDFDGFYALNRFDGEVIWKVKSLNDANEVVHHNGKIYGGSDAGEIFCIDAQSGKVDWCRIVEGQFHTKLQICESEDLSFTILAFDFFGAILLLEPEKGNLVDGIKTPYNFRSSAVKVANDEFLVISQKGKVLRIKIKGAIQISELSNITSEVYSTPIIDQVSNSLIIACAGSRSGSNLKSISLESAELIWENQDSFSSNNFRANLVINQGILWMGLTYSNKLIAIDTKKGRLIAEIELGAETFPHWSAPAIDEDGFIYLPRNDGFVYQVDREKLKINSKIKLYDEEPPKDDPNTFEAWSSILDRKWTNVFYSTPVLLDNQLYLGNDQGYFYRIDFPN